MLNNAEFSSDATALTQEEGSDESDSGTHNAHDVGTEL